MNLKTLASALGLSQTTVSRALNGYPEVSESTRLKVVEAAARLGYRANDSARRLATGRVGAVGFVLPADGGLTKVPHFSEFIGGLGGRLIEQEIDIVVTPALARDELAVYRRLASSKRVDAVILSAPILNDPRIELLNSLKMPFVLHGRTEVESPHAWFDIDNEGAFRRATSHLLDLGHRRIALGNGGEGQTFCVHRERGYRSAMLERGVDIDERLIAFSDLTDEMGFSFAERVFALDQPPTAVVTSSIPMALGVFRALRSRGLQLGRDVSMIAHDDAFPYLNAHKMVPTMTVTRSPMRDAGSRIGELIIEILNGRDPTTIHEMWPVPLVLGESTGPVPR